MRPTSFRSDSAISCCSQHSAELVGTFDQVCQAKNHKNACCGDDMGVGLPAGLLIRRHCIFISKERKLDKVNRSG